MNNSRTESGAKNKIHKVCCCEASCDKMRYHRDKSRTPHCNGGFALAYSTHMVFVITGIVHLSLQGLRTMLFPIPYLPEVFDQHCGILFLSRIAFQSEK